MSPIHPAPHLELPIMPVIHGILATDTVANCHAAIMEAAHFLQALTHCPMALVCEVTALRSGQPSIVWQAGDLSGRLPVTANTFDAWFERAREQPGRLCAFDDVTHGLLMAGGQDDIALYIVMLARPGSDLSRPLGTAMRDIAGISARHLHRLRKDEETRLLRARHDADGINHLKLLRANADLVWGAPEGIMRVTHVFNHRHDLARYFQGRPLNSLTAAGGKAITAIATGGKAVRMVRLDPRKGMPGETPLYITVDAPSGIIGTEGPSGTISAGSDTAPDQTALNAQLLETILDARGKEDELRHETEIMLRGLRTLLSPAPFREKMEHLARHLAEAVKGDIIDVIQLRPAEKPRLFLSAAGLQKPGTEALQQVLALSAGRNVTILAADSDESAMTCAAFHMPTGDIAVIAIPHQAEEFYLVCRARRAFGARDIGLAERFSLLLRQALVLRDDQDRMVHTAKLSALGQMSASVAHELRQPLNTISIVAQNVEMLIERDLAEPRILKEKVDRILQQVNRACLIMDRMRRFGRKSGGNHKSISLSATVQSAAALMQRVAEDADIHLAVDVPDDWEIVADDLDIEQVLVNLVQNAIDAIAGHERHHGQGRIHIWSNTDPTDPKVVRLHIEDNGPGFAPEILQHAMDAFFTTKEEDKGTGLGLSISHAILREHGGRLQIGNGNQGGLVTLYLRRPPKSDPSLIDGRRQ